MSNLFWERFYNACVTKGTKPNPVAKEINISSGIVTKWKTSGALPNGETLIKIADYLDCSTDYLLGRTDDDTPVSFKNKCQETICSRLAERIPYFNELDLEASGYPSYYLEELTDSNCIPLHLLLDIVDTLKVSLDYLLEYSDNPELNTSEEDLLEDLPHYNSPTSKQAASDEDLKLVAETPVSIKPKTNDEPEHT